MITTNAPLVEVATQIHFAETEAGKIAYRSSGSGPTIILCSRFRGNLDSWDPAFIGALAKNFTVITFDYLGFGSSTGVPASTAIGFAEAVKQLASALNLDKIILGGWSLGGFVATVAATELEGLVSHLILIGTKPPGEVEYGIEQIFLDTAFKPVYDLHDETILFFEPTSEKSIIASEKSSARMALWKKDPDVTIGQELWEHYLQCGADYIADPYKSRAKLSTTSIPILVISSDHEICFPPENWFALNRQLPTAQIIVIAQSGHGVQHQYPEMVARYIDIFINSQS